MSKANLLSGEISRRRALLAGGGTAQDTLLALRQWHLSIPQRGRLRPSDSIVRWNEVICSVIREVIGLGAPVGKLLREIQPMIRREERHFVKQKGVERQFAFQAAIAVVLPWAVASLSGGVRFNMFTAAGLFFQVAGLLVFAVIVRNASRSTDQENAWLFDFLVSVWMRTLAGMSLHAALVAALEQAPFGSFKEHWSSWLRAYDGGSSQLDSFLWPDQMSQSHIAAGLLVSLLRSGAPAGDSLADYIAQLDDDRQALFEERVGALPVRLSLGFCAFFAPAVFLVLFGALWPSLQI